MNRRAKGSRAGRRGDRVAAGGLRRLGRLSDLEQLADQRERGIEQQHKLRERNGVNDRYSTTSGAQAKRQLDELSPELGRARAGHQRAPSGGVHDQGRGSAGSRTEIAAPKHTDIALTVTSGDGHEHELVLETPHRYHATVRPGAPAKLLLKQLPDGSYAIEVDHVTRGRLIVGAAPGP